MEPDPYQANLSAVEMAKRDKEKTKDVQSPPCKYPIRLDKKTVIFPRTKKRYEMLSRTYPDGKYFTT